jgi:formate-dependent nitrite reductase membrane component NrfD
MGRRTRVRGSMVPEAEFTSYYGRPILKTPTWKNPDVPLYLWLGGMAGTSAVIAALADATGRPVLRRGGRLVAAGGAALGTAALIHDLGRPARFLNMLRVLKPTSPLSVGSWILSPFAAAASAAAASEITGIAPALGRAAGWGAAAFGPPLASYTGVLLADTAVPAWHEAHGELPVLFAASGAAAGAGAQLVVTGLAGADRRERGPLARLAVAGATAELAAGALLERRLERLPGGVVDAWHTGRAGRWNRLARALTVTGGLGALLTGLRGQRRAGQPGRAAAVASGAALAAGSLATRFAAFEAGRASASAPEHVVAPQRARLAQGG